MNSSPEGQIHPFQRVPCTCLICGEKSLYSRLKSTLFAETRRDIDLRPISIIWAKKVSPKVDPKLYYFWQCPFCTFTADNLFFLHPFKDGSMSLGRYRKGFQKARDERQEQFTAVVQALRLDPKSESSAFVSGLKLNLLAIYMWEMIEDISKGDSLILASYYLRLSWLLRDARVIETKSPSLSHIVKQLLQNLHSIWPEMEPTELAVLRKAFGYYKQGLSKSPSLKSAPQEVTVKLIIARLAMKLGRLDEAKRQIVESKSRLTIWEQLHPPGEDGQAQAKKELSRTKTLISNVEMIYEKVEESLSQLASDKNLRRSS